MTQPAEERAYPPVEHAEPVCDEGYLDIVFESMVRAAAEGGSFDLERAIGARPQLRDEVERLARIAGLVAVREQHGGPALPGLDLVCELGRGASGTVYLARQRGLLRPVAVKVLAPAFACSPSGRGRFRAEARALAKVRHPNVVQIHDVLEDGAACAYVMEWVEGLALARLLERLRPLGVTTTSADVARALGEPAPARPEAFTLVVCRVAIAIGRALGAVHRAGLVHRDVKPSNILVRKDGTPLLSDFGLAWDPEVSLGTETGAFVGTAAFAAPEQLRGTGPGTAAGPDARADIYGLGASLFAALAGRPPSEARSPSGVLLDIETGRTAPLRTVRPDLPRDLDTIVATATDPEPGRRYQTADALADDLERFLAFRPITASSTPVNLRVWRWTKRHRGSLTAASLGAVAMLVIAVFVGNWLLQQRNMPARIADLTEKAQLALLDRIHDERLFVLIERPAPGFAPPRRLARDLDEALAAYGDLLALDPPEAVELRLEREVVIAARRRLEQLEDSKKPPAAPLDEEPRPWSSDPWLAGLYAYLVGDVESTLDAWEDLDLSFENPNPLADAVMGQLHLQRDDPDRAYPRLLSAVRAFPDAGFLLVALADAAHRQGDARRGLEWIALARRVGMLDDPYQTDIRVEADCLARLGYHAEARAGFENMVNRGSMIARGRFAQYLERMGQLEEAMDLLLAKRPSWAKLPSALQRIAEAWWRRLDAVARVREISTLLDRDHHRHRLPEILAAESRESGADRAPPASLEDRAPNLSELDFTKEVLTMLHRLPAVPLPRDRDRLAALCLDIDGSLTPFLRRRAKFAAPWVLRLLAFLAVCSVPMPAAGQQTSFSFEFEGSPGALPNVAPNVNEHHTPGTNPWSLSTSGPGVLQQRLYGPGASNAWFQAGSFATPSPGVLPTAFAFPPNQPIVLEARIRVLAMSGRALSLAAANGIDRFGCFLTATPIGGILHDEAYTLSAPVVPFLNAFHVLRVEYDPTGPSFTVWLDGVLALGPMPTMPHQFGTNYWMFGDSAGEAGQNGDIDWDYVRISIGTGVGQANTASATLSVVNGAVETTGAVGGPHAVSGIGTSLTLNWFGPPNGLVLLFAGLPDPVGTPLPGCAGILNIGAPFVYVVGPPPGSTFAGPLITAAPLDINGHSTQTIPLPQFPPGVVFGNIQGVVVQPSSCTGAVLTAAFYLSS